MKFELILFDMMGTTVKDSNNGESLILESFFKSFYLNGFEISYEKINEQRGRSKREAINNILTSSIYNIELVEKIYNDFIEILNNSADKFVEISAATKVFGILKEKGIKIGLGSGLPMDFMFSIIKRVGWQIDNFDYIGSSEELRKGRPDPIMIIDSMEKLGINDKTKVLKIGDTVIDIQEGKNAGVLTAAVLSGTQKREQLEKYNPDYIFKDISDLLKIL